MSIVDTARGVIKPITRGLESLSGVADLGIRLWIAWVFWKSGQTKIANWDSTLFLFEDFYNVPLLPPEVAAYLGTAVELIPISTTGDRDQRGPIGTLGSQGVFTKEIQRALLDDRIDLAVHSLKDLPTDPVDGLTLAAVPQRETVRDALICRDAASMAEFPAPMTTVRRPTSPELYRLTPLKNSTQ